MQVGQDDVVHVSGRDTADRARRRGGPPRRTAADRSVRFRCPRARRAPAPDRERVDVPRRARRIVVGERPREPLPLRFAIDVDTRGARRSAGAAPIRRRGGSPRTRPSVNDGVGHGASLAVALEVRGLVHVDEGRRSGRRPSRSARRHDRRPRSGGLGGGAGRPPATAGGFGRGCGPDHARKRALVAAVARATATRRFSPARSSSSQHRQAEARHVAPHTTPTSDSRRPSPAASPASGPSSPPRRGATGHSRAPSDQSPPVGQHDTTSSQTSRSAVDRCCSSARHGGSRACPVPNRRDRPPARTIPVTPMPSGPHPPASPAWPPRADVGSGSAPAPPAPAPPPPRASARTRTRAAP